MQSPYTHFIGHKWSLENSEDFTVSMQDVGCMISYFLACKDKWMDEG